MPLPTRHLVSLAVALAAVAAVVVFAHPQLASDLTIEPGTEMVDLAEKDFISPAAVRAAFAAEGLPLPYTTAIGSPPLVTLSNSARGTATAGKLFVLVGARTGRVGFGAKFTEYDERFENVMVTYGGGDEAMLTQIRAAVETLRN
jgi:hypothetical protein